jgi:hypothetical protein
MIILGCRKTTIDVAAQEKVVGERQIDKVVTTKSDGQQWREGWRPAAAAVSR